ncbi:hypothetical protein HNQ80_004316 [Anaerosolibacter carboniphilus]|uniref:DUF2634 domain-containing protein n=1 Tax=Anaerosolibacter carboniphilus TaxID=1417629 RepID=A0A841KWV9_9FIRM|nr:DUF2634 domain-containing protein [Anaerosolibacter carboniphilus]MBB6218176.1 hypothetical protein [Anaerosolibacter carboniphilus]
MAIFPQFNIDTSNTLPSNSNVKELGRVFLFDFNEKKFVLNDGKMVEATYEQKIKMWVEQLIRTEFEKFEIYKDTDFGLEIIKFIGRRDIPVGVINSEVKRQISEKIIMHPHIEGIENFATERKNNQIIISFDVLLINENSLPMEVTMNV